MRKSRRIASFLMLSSSKIEEVSPYCFVLTLSSPKIEEFPRWPPCCLLMLHLIQAREQKEGGNEKKNIVKNNNCSKVRYNSGTVDKSTDNT